MTHAAKKMCAEYPFISEVLAVQTELQVVVVKQTNYRIEGAPKLLSAFLSKEMHPCHLYILTDLLGVNRSTQSSTFTEN